MARYKDRKLSARYRSSPIMVAECQVSCDWLPNLVLISDWPGAGLRALLRDALALAVPAHAPRTRDRRRGDVPLLPRGGDQRQAAVDTLPNVSNIFFTF